MFYCIRMKHYFTFVLLVLVTNIASVAHVVAKDWVSCFNEQETISQHGDFVEFSNDQQTQFVLFSDPENGCLIKHENGSDAEIGDITTSAYIVGVCQDTETERDNLLIHLSAGQHFTIQFWAVDPATGFPLLRYSEAWGDQIAPAGNEWGLDTLLTAEGNCLWKERQNAQQLFKTAMEELQNVAPVEAGKSEFYFSVQKVAAETISNWLSILGDEITLENARYADDSANAWQIIQILGKTLCDAAGVVLLHDKRQQIWFTLYNVPSGCTKVLNYPLRNMIVMDDQLFASMCVWCTGWGDYRDVVINLRTFRVRKLD